VQPDPTQFFAVVIQVNKRLGSRDLVTVFQLGPQIPAASADCLDSFSVALGRKAPAT